MTMKTIAWFVSGVFLAAVLLVSCEDYLDKTPDDDMTIDEVFTNPDWTRAWLKSDEDAVRETVSQIKLFGEKF